MLLFGGIIWIIVERISRKEKVGSPSYTDWYFIGLLFLIALTGILMESFRYAGVASGAYTFYLIHLIVVFSLLAYAPYSKFVHLIYRTLAMAYAKKMESQSQAVEQTAE